MNLRGVWLAGVLALTVGIAQAQDQTAEAPPAAAQPAAGESDKDWIPGPMIDRSEPVPGRVAARSIGLAFTLPESWRSDDISWRELPPEEAKTISPLAEQGLVVELADGDTPQRLLTFYRVNLEQWREADRVGGAGPGRIAITTPDKGFVVVRPPEADRPGRYADLRGMLEDVIGTLALYDAHHEERNLPQNIGGEFAGKLASGDSLAVRLESGGNLTLTMGDSRKFSGRWLLRDSQVIGQLVAAGEGVHPAMVLYFDGSALIATKWDEKVFGNSGVRLEKAQ